MSLNIVIPFNNVTFLIKRLNDEVNKIDFEVKTKIFR